MSAVWFVTLAAMLAAYAVLDGYDLGAGAVHTLVARSDRERRIVMSAIGPVWNGNEVWLIAAGGMMVVSFPRLYATAFSGFYLPLILVLWLLILRGVALEFRDQIDHGLWRDLWDAGFFSASLLLALLLGVALGNVVRGLPIGADGSFQGSFAVLLNPYALLVGVLAVCVLAWHGVNYLRVKTTGALLERLRLWSRGLGFAAVALTALGTAATFGLRAGVAANFERQPAALLLPALAVFGFARSFTGRGERADHRSFAGSTLAIAGLLGSAAATLFPILLLSTTDRAYSLTIHNSASSHHALVTAFAANLAGMLAVSFYSFHIHRLFRGKVELRRRNH